MMMDNSFIKNTAILFLGKFSTQFISLLLLPLYTHYLLTEDYGAVDLFQTYISLLIPLLTFRIDSASFRFLVDKRDNIKEKESILTNVFILLVYGIIITVIGSYIISFFIEFKYYTNVVMNLIILMISNVLIQILRGIGLTKEYSIASIITAIITLLSNIILITELNIGAISILIASSIANFICIIYIANKSSFFKFIKFEKINLEKQKEILRYAIPMIPNYLSWWIVNVSDRTIISSFLGVAYNGIYTVSCKFSNIINNVFSIVNLSWQESATLHINEKEKNLYFSDMINKILKIFSSFSIGIIAILPLVYNIIIGNEYNESYNYIPIILYANIWNVVIGLIGGIYVAVKRTKEIANTTIISAVINIVINIIFIKFIGLYAASISTLVAYATMGIYRYFDCQKYVKVKLDIKNMLIFSLIYFLVSISYYVNNAISNIIVFILVVLYIIFFNIETIKELLSIILKKRK